ncbi:WD40-repeat-containing domain protein [Spinellus fusiger]|nr:WD40-repeat-containing domain protein [Spinellus fusiger]
MSLAQPKQKTHIIFLIRQQRFLELLEKKKTLKALYILRTQLTPLAINMDRVHELSSLVLCSTPDDVKQQAQWDGADGKSRELLLVELQRHMLPAMIPRERMMTLLHQAFEWQRKGCLYHDSSEANYSLLSDHVCDKSHFPATTIRILKGHADEVWHLAFSHNGQYLASVSKDTTCTIWDVKTFDIKQVLRGVSNSSSYCEWSPDDSTLLMCGCDFTLRLWDPMTGELLQTFPKHEDQVTSCVWLPDGRHFLSGGCDKKIILWSVFLI